MDLLVIGGSGFLSRAIAEEFAAAGDRVTVFTRGARPLPAGVNSLIGDRRDYAAFLSLLEGRPFDAVIDCLCYAREDAAADLRAFAGRTGRLIMISTDFVYGPLSPAPMDEDTPTFALNQYGRDKVAAEELFISAHREEGFPVTILRPPHILGAGGQLGIGSLQGRDPMLLDRLQQGAPLVLMDSGQLLMQPVLHRDIAAACRAVIGTPAALGQAYNVAGPEVIRMRDYYDLIGATLGMEPSYRSIPSEVYLRAFPERAPFAGHRTYAVEKLARDTGYRPETEVRHALFETIDWLQANEAAQPYVPTEQDRAIEALCDAFEAEALRTLSAADHS